MTAKTPQPPPATGSIADALERIRSGVDPEVMKDYPAGQDEPKTPDNVSPPSTTGDHGHDR